MDTAVKEILEWYKSRPDRSQQESIVEMLRELQQVCGYLSEELQREAAGAAGVGLPMIRTLIRFCPDLKAAAYRHVLTVCSGERCGKKQGAAVLEAVRRTLKVGKDGLSADGRILVKTRNCLKHCQTAPNLLLDGEPAGNLRPEEIPEWLEKHCTK